MLTLNYTYRIYPSQEQQALFLQWLETCRRLYNRCLADLKLWVNSRKCRVDSCSLAQEYIVPPAVFPDYLTQKRQLTQWKVDNQYYQALHSQVLQDVVKRVHNTWEAFKRRGYGFPRFRKYGQYKSFYFPQVKQSALSVQTLNLPKLGEVTINVHRPIPDGFQIKGVRILSRARGTIWYAVITLQSDVKVPSPAPHGRAIGVDVGLENFLATSDGLSIQPARFFRDLQRRLKVLQRRASRKKQCSQNYHKAQRLVAKLHHDINNTRKNFHFQVAHQLCDQAEMVFVEDIDFTKTAKGFLGKQMLDGGFGQFRQILQWVCCKRGVYFAEVDHRGTSKACPECGADWDNSLSIRWHHCDECGYQGARDVASAQVIKQRGESIVPMDSRERKLPADSVLPGLLLGKCYAGRPSREVGKLTPYASA